MRQYVCKKEYLYLALKVVFTVAILYGVTFEFARGGKASAMITTSASYLLFFLTLVWVRNGLFVGYVRRGCVKVGPQQYPDVYEMLLKHCEKLHLKNVPSLYIMQSGGVLNALATRFVGRDYIVLYSDILAVAYEDGGDAVEFIIGHELGHIMRRHMTLNMLLFPSIIVPFLQNAYSRACEYSCDGIGYSLTKRGAVKGLCILSVGSDLYRKMNVRQYIADAGKNGGFWGWLAELFSTHPFLPDRISNLTKLNEKGI